MNQQRNGHDRVAVVTGASQGIGQAFAVRLAETGRRVVLADITDTSETEKLARHAGAEVLSVHTDVSDEQSVAHLRRQVEGTFGGTDILVNNAGTAAVQAFEDTTLEQWRRMMAINLDSMFLTCQAFLPGMRERGWGRVVNMSSNTLDLHLPWGGAHYIASKGGIVGLTRALASEYGPFGITVNAIAPGLVRRAAVRRRHELACRGTAHQASRAAGRPRRDTLVPGIGRRGVHDCSDAHRRRRDRPVAHRQSRRCPGPARPDRRGADR